MYCFILTRFHVTISVSKKQLLSRCYITASPVCEYTSLQLCFVPVNSWDASALLCTRPPLHKLCCMPVIWREHRGNQFLHFNIQYDSLRQWAHIYQCVYARFWHKTQLFKSHVETCLKCMQFFAMFLLTCQIQKVTRNVGVVSKET